MARQHLKTAHDLDCLLVFDKVPIYQCLLLKRKILEWKKYCRGPPGTRIIIFSMVYLNFYNLILFTGDDPCLNHNGGCSDICTAGPDGIAQCSCPDFSGTKPGNQGNKMCIPINNNCTNDQFVCRYGITFLG